LENRFAHRNALPEICRIRAWLRRLSKFLPLCAYQPIQAKKFYLELGQQDVHRVVLRNSQPEERVPEVKLVDYHIRRCVDDCNSFTIAYEHIILIRCEDCQAYAGL